MPRVNFSDDSLNDLDRSRDFREGKKPSSLEISKDCEISTEFTFRKQLSVH
jgi:hypothetical protein